MASIDFYFGPGSRYSYLAAARIPSLEQEIGATVRWRALYSPELIKRSGSGAFVSANPRGQYGPAYRTRDAQRWASFLGVSYVEPDFASFDSKPLALWSVAAELLGNGAAFATAILHAVFGLGTPPRSPEELAAMAQQTGLPADRMLELIRSGKAAEAHEQNINDALLAGAFGVPTFVTEDGEMFWGQDRVPLLVHHLSRRGA